MPRRRRQPKQEVTSLPSVDRKFEQIMRNLDELDSDIGNIKNPPVLKKDIQELSGQISDLNLVISKLASSISGEKEVAPTPKLGDGRVGTPRKRSPKQASILASIREQLKILNKQGSFSAEEYKGISTTISESIRGLDKQRLLEMRDLLKKKTKTESDVDRLAELVKEGKDAQKKLAEEKEIDKIQQGQLDDLYKSNVFLGMIGSLFIKPKKKEVNKSDKESIKEYFIDQEQKKQKREQEKQQNVLSTEEILKRTFTPIREVFEGDEVTKPLDIRTYTEKEKEDFELGLDVFKQNSELLKLSEDQLVALNSISTGLKQYHEQERKRQEDLLASQSELMREAKSASRVGTGMIGTQQMIPQQTTNGGSNILSSILMASAATTVAPAAVKAGGGLLSRVKGWFGKGAAKTGAETGAKVAEKVGLKGALKIGGKGIGKSILKKIPGIGLLAGLGFGAHKLMSGDAVGAGGEVLSGAASLLPGVGTAASLAIDASLAKRDYDIENKTVKPMGIKDVFKNMISSSQQTDEQVLNKKEKEIGIADKAKVFASKLVTNLAGPIAPLIGLTPTTAMEFLGGRAPDAIKPVMQPKIGSDAPVGLRVNNPGNLRDNNTQWLGKEGSDTGFVKFKSAEYGIRAAAKNLQTQIKRNPELTLGEYISKYAPSNENDTEGYISRVEQETGINRNTILPDTEETYQKVVKSMLGVEVGGVLAGKGSAKEKVEKLYGGEANLNKIITTRNIDNASELENIYRDTSAKFDYEPAVKYAVMVKPTVPPLTAQVEKTKPQEVKTAEYVPTPTNAGLKMTATTVDNFNRDLAAKTTPVVINNTPVVNTTSTTINGGGSDATQAVVSDSRNSLPVFVRMQEKDFMMV